LCKSQDREVVELQSCLSGETEGEDFRPFVPLCVAVDLELGLKQDADGVSTSCLMCKMLTPSDMFVPWLGEKKRVADKIRNMFQQVKAFDLNFKKMID